MGLSFKIYRNGELVATESFDREIIKIGRLSSAHLRLDDEKVSRIHAVVEVSANGEVNIIDMGSADGTFVNGERVNKHQLQNGDEIVLGNTRLVFTNEAADAVPAQGLSNFEESTAVVQPEHLAHGSLASSAAAAPPAEEPKKKVTPAPQAAAPASLSADDPLSAAASAPAEEDEEPDEAIGESSLSEAEDSDELNLKAKEKGKAKEKLAKPKAEAPRAAAKAKPAEEQKATPTKKPALSPKAAAKAAPKAQPRPKAAAAPRVALPPPANLGEMVEGGLGGGGVLLEVRKLWWEDVLDVKGFYRDHKQVLIGDDAKADFFAPVEVLPAKVFPIARMVGADAIISFGKKCKGELKLKDGTVVSLKDLASSGKVGQDPEHGDCKTFSLPDGAVATVAFGNLGFRFRALTRPAGFLSKLTDRLDYSYLNLLLLVMFLFIAGIATVHLRPKTLDLTDEDLYKVPDRYVQFIIQREKPQKKDLAALEKLKGDDAAKEKSAERYKGQEGKMGIKGMPDTGKRSAIKAIKIDDKELVGNRGLLAVLGAGGPEGLSTVMGGTGLGGELQGAIGNMFGKEIGNSGGFGGLGLKGTGPGGGGVGNTIGVGAVGTRGRGGGAFGYGAGAAKIRRRGESNVSISVGNPVIQGSLSMEIIRRVVHSHHDQISYCYSKELTRSPNLRGKVTINWTISAQGFVTQSSVKQSTLDNAAVEQCIVSKVRTWKFPEPKGGGVVIVNYPFILNPSGG